MSLISLIIYLTLHAVPLFSFTVMLDPSGDARNGGREIGDCFERGISMQYAQALKERLEVAYPGGGVKVIISRCNREVIETLQSANFANRLAVDLFISIHFFQEMLDKPILYLYCFSNTSFGLQPSQYNPLACISYDQAYIKNSKLSRHYAHITHEICSGYANLFEVNALSFFPCKPLLGVQPPAFAFEASLNDTKNWQIYVEPLVRAIGVITR
jgi:N-acetylmuramoyl-L-alanine amidase